MIEGFNWLIAIVGLVSIFKGVENIFPRIARNKLEKRLKQPDYYFRAVGALFLFFGLMIIYVGLR